MGAIVVWTAMSDGKLAEKLAGELVRKKLAACVSLVPGAVSTYRWKGKIERTREVLVMVKTSSVRWKALQKFVLSRHPYELPELIAVRVSAGSKKYLNWIDSSLGL